MLKLSTQETMQILTQVNSWAIYVELVLLKLKGERGGNRHAKNVIFHYINVHKVGLYATDWAG